MLRTEQKTEFISAWDLYLTRSTARTAKALFPGMEKGYRSAACLLGEYAAQISMAQQADGYGCHSVAAGYRRTAGKCFTKLWNMTRFPQILDLCHQIEKNGGINL